MKSQKTALYWGAGITCALIYLWLLGDIDYSTRGARVDDWPWFGKILLTIPSVLVMIYGLRPNSMLGIMGRIIFELSKKVFKKK